MATFAKMAKTAKIVPSAIRACDYGNGDGNGDDNGDHGDGNSDGATCRGLNRAPNILRGLCACVRVRSALSTFKKKQLSAEPVFAFRKYLLLPVGACSTS